MSSKWINIGDGGVSYLEIKGKACSITLEERPAYCDRGNYIAKLFPTGELSREIDDQDGFPRYYFDESRAKLELEAWMRKRNQLIGSDGQRPT